MTMLISAFVKRVSPRMRQVLGVLALLMALGALVLWQLASAPAPVVLPVPKPTAPAFTAPAFSLASAPGVNPAIAQRQSRCRALNQQLGLLAKAPDPAAAQAALKAMGLLAGEMMNGYLDAQPDPRSRASAALFSPGGPTALRESRRALLSTLHSVRGMAGQQAASRVSASCTACHSRFVRDGGHDLVLLGSFEKDATLSLRFQKVDGVEPTVQETVDILKGLNSRSEGG